MKEEDYSRCLSWSHFVAPHEAAFLCPEVPSHGQSKSARQSVHDACRKQEGDRLLLARLRNQLDASVSALKCGMASNAAAEASLRATQLASDKVSALSDQLVTFFRDLSDAGAVDPSAAQDPQWKAVFRSIEDVKTLLSVQQRAADYADHASKGTTDAAARGVREAMQHARSATTKILLDQKGSSESAAQRASQDLPVVPGSLFGGRWFAALASLNRHQECRQQLRSLMGSSSNRDGRSRSSSSGSFKRPLPFRGSGDQPPKKAKGADSSKAAGKSSSSSSSSSSFAAAGRPSAQRPRKGGFGDKRGKGGARSSSSAKGSGGQGKK